MGAGEFGIEVTIPVLMIHYDDGAILRPADADPRRDRQRQRPEPFRALVRASRGW